MKNFFIFKIVLLMVLSILFYFLTYSLIFSISLFIFIIIASLFETFYIFLPYVKQNEINLECLSFMEKFITSYDSFKSFNLTFESIIPFLSSNRKEIIENNINDLHIILDSFKEVYKAKMFDIFTKIIYQFEITGGSLINSSSFLLKEIERAKNKMNNVKTGASKSLYKYILMWIFTFAILIVAKVSLKSIFNEFSENIMFVSLIFIGFLVFELSFYIFLKTEISFLKMEKE